MGMMIPTALLVPKTDLSANIIALPSSWQIPALMITGLVCGKKTGFISTVAYLVIGIFYLPIFHGGGSTGYLMTPEMGYLIGFIPAIWLVGQLSESKKQTSLIELTYYALLGLLVIHSVGIVNIIFGSLTSRWSEGFLYLIYIYTISTLPSQFIVCPAIAIISKSLKFILVR